MSKESFTEIEISVLASANEDRQINIPCGSAVEIDAFLRTLLRLEKAGLVSRVQGNAFYRPFILTEQGLSVKSARLARL